MAVVAPPSTDRGSRFEFDVGTHGRVSGAIYRAPSPMHATLILAHGAGAPRTHPFMIDMATRLSNKGLDVVTFNFLYAEVGRKMPDRVDLLEATWRAAIATVRARGGVRTKAGAAALEEPLHTERLFIGGKSMGGRIATHIAAAGEGLEIAGVVLLGYPLHPINKPRVVREEILGVTLPMLVVQGTRDELGTADEVKKLLTHAQRDHKHDLRHARVHVVETGDHSLVLSPKNKEAQERALDQAADAIVLFVQEPLEKPKKKSSRAKNKKR